MIEILEGLYAEKCASKGSDIAGHLPHLRNLVETIKPKLIIHAGIREGNSGIALGIGAYNVNAKMIDIDLNDYINYESAYDLIDIRNQISNWAFIQGSTEQVFPQLAEYSGDVDIFFTDTSHNYEDTKFEFKNYATLLSPTGIILTHDMDPWNHWADQARAVDEWLVANPEWKHQTQKGNNGMTIFYRDEAHLCGVKCDVDLKMGRLTD